MTRRLRWLLIALLAVLAILTGVAVGSWYLLERYGALFAKERIEAALTRALDRPVTIGEVRLRPWLGRLQVLNVEIGPGTSSGGDPLLQLGRGEARIGISSLWRRELVISRVLLEDLTLRLVSSGPSGSRLTLDLPDRIELGSVSVQVQTVQVRRGRVTYQDRTEGAVLEFQGLEGLARPLDRGIDATVEVASVRLQLPMVREEFNEVRVTGWIHQQRGVVRNLTARWHGRAVQASGEVRQPFDAPELRLRLRGDLELAALAKSLQSPIVVAGTARVDATLDGPIEALKVSGQIRVPSLTAGPVRATEVTASGEVRALPKSPELHVQVRGVVDLAGIAKQADAPWPVVGTATAEGRVEGSPDALRVTGRVTSPVVTAGPLQARAVVVSGEVQGLPRAPDLRLQVRGESDLAGLGTHVGAPWPLTGTATAEGRVEGPAAGLRVSGRVSIPQASGGPLRVQEMVVEGRWEGRQLDLPSIRARVFDGDLSGSLATQLDRLHETRLAFTLRRAKVPQVEALAPEPPGLRGEVDVEAALDGDPRRLGDLRGRVSLAGREIVLPRDLSRHGPGTVALQGTIHDGSLDLARASGSWPGVRVEVSGPVRIEGPQGTRVAVDADLGRVLPLWDVRQVGGQAHLAGVLTGRWDNPEAIGQARAPLLTLADARIEELELPFRIADRILVLTSANGRLGQSRVGITGMFTWRLEGDRPGAPAGYSPQFQADIRAASARWEDVNQWLPPGGQGTGRFTLGGRLEGTLVDWRGSGTLEAAALTLRPGIPIQDLQSAFTLDTHRVDVLRLQATARGVPIRGSGGWRWDGTGRATAHLGPVELAAIPEVPPAAGLQGTGRAQVEITTAPGRVEILGTSTVERAQVFDTPLGTGTMQAALRDGVLQGDLAFPETRLTASFRGRTDGPEPLSVRAEVKGFELAPILRRAGGTGGIRIEGTVSAVAELTVSVRPPGDVRGTVRLDPVRLSVEDEAWTNQGPVVLRWGAGELLIERLQLGGRLGNARAAGRVVPSGALELDLAGQVPLAVLPLFRPEVRTAEGLLVLAARVEGTTAAPRITGEATVRDGKIQLADYPETFRDLSGRLLLSPQGIRLVEATSLLGRGRLRASGEMTLEGWRPGVYRFAVAGRDVALAPFEGLRTAWDADLELVGQGNRAQLRGAARLLQGTYAGQLSVLSLILSERRERAAAPAFALPLRIQLRLDNNLRVETNLAKLRVGGTLSLEGTTADPVLFGSLESREGRITFRKNRYEVIAAAVRFTDPRKIDPILDVTARARIKEYDVTVRLTGRPEELSVRFSSSPALGEEELLLLTALGITREEAGRSPAGIAAGQIVSLLLDELLGPEVAQYGLDVFEIQTTGKAEQEQQSVRVGKQVTEDLRVLYSQSIAGASKRVLRVEYQLIGPLFLAGEQDFQGGVGGDVLLRLRFR